MSKNARCIEPFGCPKRTTSHTTSQARRTTGRPSYRRCQTKSDGHSETFLFEHPILHSLSSKEHRSNEPWVSLSGQVLYDVRQIIVDGHMLFDVRAQRNGRLSIPARAMPSPFELRACRARAHESLRSASQS